MAAKVSLEQSSSACASCGGVYEGNEAIVFESGQEIVLCSYDKLMLHHLLNQNDKDESVKVYPHQKE